VFVVGYSFDNVSSGYTRIKMTRKMGGRSLTSTAAGRYQFLSRTWDDIVERCGFRGRFIPDAQVLAAIKLIKERRAYDDVVAGRFEVAVAKCRNIWASLPGAGYGQPEHKMVTLVAAYTSAGGKVA